MPFDSGLEAGVVIGAAQHRIKELERVEVVPPTHD
jgi:hypothetical protein